METAMTSGLRRQKNRTEGINYLTTATMADTWVFGGSPTGPVRLTRSVCLCCCQGGRHN